MIIRRILSCCGCGELFGNDNNRPSLCKECYYALIEKYRRQDEEKDKKIGECIKLIEDAKRVLEGYGEFNSIHKRASDILEEYYRFHGKE